MKLKPAVLFVFFFVCLFVFLEVPIKLTHL